MDSGQGLTAWAEEAANSNPGGPEPVMLPVWQIIISAEQPGLSLRFLITGYYDSDHD